MSPVAKKTRRRRSTTKIDQASVIMLRNGGGLVGRQRTWPEVGEILGFTPAYCRRTASSDVPPHLAPVRFDVRSVVPELKPLLDDDALEAWLQDPHCLCGCGRRTKQVRDKRSRFPQGSYRPFLSGHEQTMPWIRRPMIDPEVDARRRVKISLTAAQNKVDASMLRELLIEFRTAYVVIGPVCSNKRCFHYSCVQIHAGRMTLEVFAVHSGINLSYIRDVASGRRKRVLPATMGRFLAAMDEPMRPEIQRAYQGWRAKQDSA